MRFPGIMAIATAWVCLVSIGFAAAEGGSTAVAPRTPAAPINTPPANRPLRWTNLRRVMSDWFWFGILYPPRS